MKLSLALSLLTSALTIGSSSAGLSSLKSPKQVDESAAKEQAARIVRFLKDKPKFEADAFSSFFSSSSSSVEGKANEDAGSKRRRKLSKKYAYSFDTCVTASPTTAQALAVMEFIQDPGEDYIANLGISTYHALAVNDEYFGAVEAYFNTPTAATAEAIQSAGFTLGQAHPSIDFPGPTDNPIDTICVTKYALVLQMENTCLFNNPMYLRAYMTTAEEWMVGFAYGQGYDGALIYGCTYEEFNWW